MLDIWPNYIAIREVMANLREEGARCCLIHYPQKKEVVIHAALKDGRLWKISKINNVEGKNEAVVECATK